MKKNISFIIKALVFVILIPSISFAAPNIDGVMKIYDSNDWGSFEKTDIDDGFTDTVDLKNVTKEEGYSFNSSLSHDCHQSLHQKQSPLDQI